MTEDDKRDDGAPAGFPSGSALSPLLFTALQQYGEYASLIEGQVAQHRDNGFTDEQARCIVAFGFGWRPPSAEPPEDREGL